MFAFCLQVTFVNAWQDVEKNKKLGPVHHKAMYSIH